MSKNVEVSSTYVTGSVTQTIHIKVNFSLWSAIKMRIAGIKNIINQTPDEGDDCK